jgi:ABC-type uncharacterized transport system substrate-binding protein
VCAAQHARRCSRGGPRIEQAKAGRAGAGHAPDAGLAEGRDYTVEYQWANSNALARLRALAEDLVKREVVVIVTAGSLGPTRAAKAVTATTPVVFVYGGDPVRDGLVASMNRPGGNVTGLTALTTELAGKRLDLLHKLVPNVETIGFLAGVERSDGFPRWAQSQVILPKLFGHTPAAGAFS